MPNDRLAQLEKLHAADPADADVPYMIALEHAKTDRLDEALAWLDKAIATDPDHHYAYYQKGKLLAAQDKQADAKAALEAGLARAQAARHTKAASELAELLDTL